MSATQIHGAEEETGGSKASGKVSELIPRSLNKIEAKSNVSEALCVSRQLRSIAQQKQEEIEEWRWEETEEDKLMRELMQMEAEEASEEGRQVKWWGDSLPQSKKDDAVLRIAAQNQDKMGAWANCKQKEGGEHKFDEKVKIRTPEEQWLVWKQRGVDILLLADTGLEDGWNCNQTALQSAGKVEEQMRRVWSDNGARWVSAQGYKAREGGWKGGTAAVQQGRLRPYAGRKVTDCRGLGRYVMLELVGANGCKTAIMIWYVPTRALSGAWAYQTELMNRWREELTAAVEQGRQLSDEEARTLQILQMEGVNPKKLLLMDATWELKRMGAEYLIVGGDANCTPPQMEAARSSSRIKTNHIKDTQMMEEFCEELQLVEPYRALGHEEIPRTWAGRGKRMGEWSWIDYWLVSRKLIDRGLIKGTGVLRDYEETTDHAAIYLDIDMGNMLGKSELWEHIKEAVEKRKQDHRLNSFGAVKPKEVGRVKQFHDVLLKQERV